jgi:hypothetical protein
MWLYILMEELGKEYTHRFGKVHKTILDHSLATHLLFQGTLK